MDTALQAMLEMTLHMDNEAVPWAAFTVGETKVLHCDPEKELIVSIVRAFPNTETGLHRHLGHAFGYTLKGAWGHDRLFKYTPGVYNYETPGVVHQFLNGPEVTEVLFINEGVIEFVNPESTDEVTGRLTAADLLRSYYEACEEAAIERPAILGQ
jgi:2,4'-dihydroxyacetophenone dioxygenase